MKLLDHFAQDCFTDLGIGAHLDNHSDIPDAKKADHEFCDLLSTFFPGKETDQTATVAQREQLFSAYATAQSAYLCQGVRMGIDLGARLMLELILAARSPMD